MCKYPFGSGGKRVRICLYFPVRTSSATMSRIKSDGLSVSDVIGPGKAIGELADGQLSCIRLFFWGAQAASLQSSTACRRHLCDPMVIATKSFSASCRKEQAGSLC